MQTADASLIEKFLDSLWLEKGLSENTLKAYRNDLEKFADWVVGMLHLLPGIPGKMYHKASTSPLSVISLLLTMITRAQPELENYQP